MEEVTENITTPSFKYFPFFNAKQPLFVLVVLGILFYCTSLYNEYALDDGIVIHQNEYVLKGVVGIPDILFKDTYASFYERMNAKKGSNSGRYAPLACVSYAIEQQFIGVYRSGNYSRAYDLNNNGKLDTEEVSYTSMGIPKKEYEYNDYVDVNNDKVAQTTECYQCWDLNKNFANDLEEDLNEDGIFNDVDCQVNGSSFRHFNNIWLYIVACLLLYLLFKNHLLKSQPDIAFLAALLFLVHPVHSEVVANIKGRDEIFSVIFCCLTFIFAFKFFENKKMLHLILTGIFLLLALLSKDYALSILVLLPIAASLTTQHKLDKTLIGSMIGLVIILSLGMLGLDKEKLQFGLPAFVFVFIGVIVFCSIILVTCYQKLKSNPVSLVMFIVSSITLFQLGLSLDAINIFGADNNELLNNPLLFATGEQVWATKIYVLLKYLGLLIFPHPLISDYSYNTIALRSFTSWDFLLAILVFGAIILFAIRLIRKKQLVGLALSSYLLFMLFGSIFTFSNCPILSESKLFHASIAFTAIAAWLIIKGLDRITVSNKRSVLVLFLFVLTFLYGCKTWERNWDWKNDVTLFLKDVNNAPNSVLVLGNAGARWIDLADTKEITGTIEKTDSSAFNDYNGTLKITAADLKQFNVKTNREAAILKGIDYLKHSVELHPKYVNGFLNLGLAYYKLDKFKEATYYWKYAEELYPDNPYLLNYYYVYYKVLIERGNEAVVKNDYKQAISFYNLASIVDEKNEVAWQKLAEVCSKIGALEAAKKYASKVLVINTDNESAKSILEGGSKI
jgi:protein O-mannosyl-transferase